MVIYFFIAKVYVFCLKNSKFRLYLAMSRNFVFSFTSGFTIHIKFSARCISPLICHGHCCHRSSITSAYLFLKPVLSPLTIRQPLHYCTVLITCILLSVGAQLLYISVLFLFYLDCFLILKTSLPCFVGWHSPCSPLPLSEIDKSKET